MSEFPLIATIAAGFTAAWVLGLVTHRLGGDQHAIQVHFRTEPRSTGAG